MHCVLAMYRERVIFEKKGGEKEGRCTGEERLRRGTSTVGTATDRLKERKVRSKKTHLNKREFSTIYASSWGLLPENSSGLHLNTA